MKRTLFAVMALLASGAALADECSSANTQTEMNQCAAAQYQAADKKLNDTWQQALQRAVGKQQTLLKQAQQAWIALRDADCAFLASGAEGGSMQPMLVSHTGEAEERGAGVFPRLAATVRGWRSKLPAAARQLTDAKCLR